jgi:hypothetical protein
MSNIDEMALAHFIVSDDVERSQLPLNIRVADIQAVYEEWSARGAEFLTPSKQQAEGLIGLTLK